MVNHQAYIGESEELIIPIDVQYRGRIEPLSLEIPLQKVVIENEKQLNQKYLKEIERMSKENLTIDRYKEKVLWFKSDTNNTNIKNFDLTQGKNLIKYTANNIHTICNHV